MLGAHYENLISCARGSLTSETYEYLDSKVSKGNSRARIGNVGISKPNLFITTEAKELTS